MTGRVVYPNKPFERTIAHYPNRHANATQLSVPFARTNIYLVAFFYSFIFFMYICICILFVLILSFLNVTIFRCIPSVVNLLSWCLIAFSVSLNCKHILVVRSSLVISCFVISHCIIVKFSSRIFRMNFCKNR